MIATYHEKRRRGGLYLWQRTLRRRAGVDQNSKAERQVDLARKIGDLLPIAVLEVGDVFFFEACEQTPIAVLRGKENVHDLGIDLDDLVLVLDRRRW